MHGVEEEHGRVEVKPAHLVNQQEVPLTTPISDDSKSIDGKTEMKQEPKTEHQTPNKGCHDGENSGLLNGIKPEIKPEFKVEVKPEMKFKGEVKLTHLIDRQELPLTAPTCDYSMVKEQADSSLPRMSELDMPSLSNAPTAESEGNDIDEIDFSFLDQLNVDINGEHTTSTMDDQAEVSESSALPTHQKSKAEEDIDLMSTSDQRSVFLWTVCLK